MKVELEHCTKLVPDEWLLLSELYETAFPPEERRTTDKLLYMIENTAEMVFNKILCEGELAGLQIYWNFGEFCYLEHFAVFEHMRGRGIGFEVLQLLRTSLDKPLVLEVEPDEGGITKRRVEFYRRCGFEVVDKNYIQPRYDAPGDAIPLWIMATAKGNYPLWIETIKKNAYYKFQA